MHEGAISSHDPIPHENGEAAGSVKPKGSGCERNQHLLSRSPVAPASRQASASLSAALIMSMSKRFALWGTSARSEFCESHAHPLPPPRGGLFIGEGDPNDPFLLPGPPMNWIPTWSPPAVHPAGTEIAGSPATLTGSMCLMNVKKVLNGWRPGRTLEIRFHRANGLGEDDGESHGTGKTRSLISTSTSAVPRPASAFRAWSRFWPILH